MDWIAITASCTAVVALLPAAVSHRYARHYSDRARKAALRAERAAARAEASRRTQR